MLGHKKLIQYAFHICLLLVASLWNMHSLLAARVTQVVEFSTTQSGATNELVIKGTLDTLAQGLRQVDFGATTVATHGSLHAELTFETFRQLQPVLLGVRFLTNRFQQGAVSLSYHVPNTTRQVSFTADNLQYSLDLENIAVDNPPGSLFSASSTGASGGLSMHPSAYQMVQNQGMAQIAITNRPSKQQSLFEQQITSAYVEPGPDPQLQLASFGLVPLSDDGSDYFISASFPIVHQQLRYTGVGLPVTLAYSGTLQLLSVGAVNMGVPEPSALVLAGISTAWLLLRRQLVQRRLTA